MGRVIPLDDDLLIHPVLSLSLIAAGMAATLAMVTALCGVRFRRRSSPPTELQTAGKTDSAPSSVPTPATASPSLALPQSAGIAGEIADAGESTTEPFKELPLPPKLQRIQSACPPDFVTKSKSERKISLSLSVKVPRSLSVAKHRDQQSRKARMKSEDSLWTKAIILGDKCKVPDEEDAAVYDDKGNRISTYHPKNASSISMSTQGSVMEAALAAQQEELEKEMGK